MDPYPIIYYKKKDGVPQYDSLIKCCYEFEELMRDKAIEFVSSKMLVDSPLDKSRITIKEVLQETETECGVVLWYGRQEYFFINYCPVCGSQITLECLKR